MQCYLCIIRQDDFQFSFFIVIFKMFYIRYFKCFVGFRPFLYYRIGYTICIDNDFSSVRRQSTGKTNLVQCHCQQNESSDYKNNGSTRRSKYSGTANSYTEWINKRYNNHTD